MRNQKQNLSNVQKAVRRLSGIVTRNGGSGFINWLLKVNFVVRGGNTSALARSAVVAVRTFYRVYQAQGKRGLILFTKNSYVLLMQAVAGTPGSSWLLGHGVKVDRTGIPVSIPRQHRDLIRKGNTTIIRIWLSWFSVYRILTVDSPLKLETITKPGVQIHENDWKEIFQAIDSFLVKSLKVKSPPKLDFGGFLPLNKSTPSIKMGKDKVSWSPLGITTGAAALISNGPLAAFEIFLTLHNDRVLKNLWDYVKTAGFKYKDLPCGKLGFKVEAAGKVRVFAMVECWTQWALSPLHDALFRLLAKLPSDGTFDQLAPIKRLIDAGNIKFWCYDLSAATDRLPVDLQANILNEMFKSTLGFTWKSLLVDRDYVLPLKLSTGIISPKIYPRSVKYEVGQPMGALSSWAMLAITHHFIIHWAAYRRGFPWGTFWDYAVLGDDGVICNGDVANEYLRLMTLIGVEIGVHKSLVSRKGVLEFAKRFYVRGKDCSPIPFKEMVAALVNFESSTEFIRKYELGFASIAGFLGLGYKVRGHLSASFSSLNRKLATIGIWRLSPWGPLPLNVSSWLRVDSLIPKKEDIVGDYNITPTQSEPLMKFLNQERQKLKSFLSNLDNLERKRKIDLVKELKVISEKFSTFSEYPLRLYSTFEIILSDYFNRRIPTVRRDALSLLTYLDRLPLVSILPDYLLTNWMRSKLELPEVRLPEQIGTKRKLDKKPTPLLAARLYRLTRRNKQK